MKRVLTGVKASGIPHLGKYYGAIRPALELAARADVQGLYFIADYHALTSVHDRGELDRLIRGIAAAWLAFGLDPDRALFYRQSAVPETFELTWILACFTSKGLLNRAHAYKARVEEAVRKQLDPDALVDSAQLPLVSEPKLAWRIVTVPAPVPRSNRIERRLSRAWPPRSPRSASRSFRACGPIGSSQCSV